MRRELDGQSLIRDFFAALQRREIDQCEQAQNQLNTLSQRQPIYRPWCIYFEAVLVNVRDKDPAESTRILRRLLQTNLDLPLQGRVLLALGRLYQYQGQWTEAIEIYERSLSIFGELKQPIDQAKSWNQIAISYCRGFIQNDFGSESLKEAKLNCQKSLDVLASLSDIEWLKGSIFNTLGVVHTYLEQWDSAIAYYEKDLHICREQNDRFGMGLSYGNLGEIYQKRGPDYWSQAEEAYGQALSIIREFNDPYEETDALQNLGSLYWTMSSHDKAMEQYNQAVHLIEGLRASISDEEARTGFFATVLDIYTCLIELYLDMGKTPAAFDVVERARARSFIEILAEHPIRPPEQVPPSLLTQEQNLRQELRQLYVNADKQSERIVQLEQALADVLQQIRLLDSQYTDLRTVHPLNHTQIQERLPVDMALVSYFTTSKNILAFVVTHDDLTIHTLALSSQDLQRVFDTNGYLERINPSSDGRLHEPWLLPPLYQRLIEPLAPHIQGKKTLCIVPHGLLHYVPFHALAYTKAGEAMIEGQSRALLDDYEILYAPSATVLLEYCRGQQSSSRSCLAIGYNDNDLRHTESEAIAIANLLDHGVALVGQDATVEAVLQHAESANWVHFCCHGRFSGHAPLLSQLHLADSPFYASDILHRLSLQANLVTLSACETGRSQVLKGDELVGLVRAFIYAGTPSVLVSLWPVDELSTRIFMTFFYKELLKGQPKAAALRTAQRTLRSLPAQQIEALLIDYGESDPQDYVERLANLTQTTLNSVAVEPDTMLFKHPYFWAPFILVGDQIAPSR